MYESVYWIRLQRSRKSIASTEDCVLHPNKNILCTRKQSESYLTDTDKTYFHRYSKPSEGASEMGLVFLIVVEYNRNRW